MLAYLDIKNKTKKSVDGQDNHTVLDIYIFISSQLLASIETPIREGGGGSNLLAISPWR